MSSSPSSDPPEAEPSAQPGAELSGGRRGLLAVGALLALAAIVLLGREAGPLLERFQQWVQGLGFWAPLVFVLGYAAATVTFLPGSVLTAAAGAIFGIGFGTVYALLGATFGAACAFLVSRYAARQWVQARVEREPRFAAIDRAVAREGRKIVFLLRLSPVFPFNLLNYALGLTRIRFVDYFVASIGMAPGTLLYVYLGALGGAAAQAAGSGGASASALQWALRIAGLLATVAVTALVTRTARRALAEEIEGVG